jgi:hypothetical protein
VTKVLEMHANLMSWQDRRIGDGDSAVNSMTYNDQSRGDLHVIFKRWLASNRRSERAMIARLLTVKHARVGASVVVHPFEDRLCGLRESPCDSM